MPRIWIAQLDHPPRRYDPEAKVASLCLAGLILIALLASLLGCSRPSPRPPPDVQVTLRQLDRIGDGLIAAEVVRCHVHAGGRCL